MRENRCPSIPIESGDFLTIVDLQPAFMPGGSMPVNGGEKLVVPIMATAAINFPASRRVATRDVHPVNHVSFKIWPPHAIEGTAEADLHPDLLKPGFLAITWNKGMDPDCDSYSGFEDAKERSTGLGDWLRNRGGRRVFICGLAFDYCVGFTALDAQAEGFETFVLTDLSLAVAPGSESKMREQLLKAGVHLIHSSQMVSTPRRA